MSVEVVLDTPLAHALNAAIQPKLVEVGWSTGAEGSDLSEYIILMLANGKTQEQIAAELSGDLLNLGPDDPGAREFSQWLFHQVDALNAQQNGGNEGSLQAGTTQVDTSSGTQDADMGDVSEGVDGNVYVISSINAFTGSHSPLKWVPANRSQTHGSKVNAKWRKSTKRQAHAWPSSKGNGQNE